MKADTQRAKRILETSHPPVYYIAPQDIKMDACYVDGERVQTQEGDFYGGWITSNIIGPFKGGAGTSGW